MFDFDVIIIGSGPAGYSAGVYAVRGGLRTCMVQGYQIGGQLTTTTDVENYPGFSEVIQGPWLMEQMSKQVERLGVEIMFDHVSSVSKDEVCGYKLTCESGKVYTTKCIIVATGAQAKWLGLESEKKFLGYGVSSCATCDGFFFKERKVVVVGGGNTAVEEALYLTNHADVVYLVHRRDSLRAEKVLQDRLFANKKVEILWNKVLDEVIGEDSPNMKVTSVRLCSTLDRSQYTNLEVDGVFIAIGHSPNTAIFKDLVDMDSEGYIITNRAYGATSTSVPGIFAAGDVQDKVYRQAITAAGTGCQAALDVVKYLEQQA